MSVCCSVADVKAILCFDIIQSIIRSISSLKYTESLSAFCNVSLCVLAGLVSFLNYLLQFFFIKYYFLLKVFISYHKNATALFVFKLMLLFLLFLFAVPAKSSQAISAFS